MISLEELDLKLLKEKNDREETFQTERAREQILSSKQKANAPKPGILKHIMADSDNFLDMSDSDEEPMPGTSYYSRAHDYTPLNQRTQNESEQRDEEENIEASSEETEHTSEEYNEEEIEWIIKEINEIIENKKQVTDEFSTRLHTHFSAIADRVEYSVLEIVFRLTKEKYEKESNNKQNLPIIKTEKI